MTTQQEIEGEGQNSEHRADPAGFVLLWRRITENPVWTRLDPSVLKVMLAFILRANWKPAKWYDGRRQIEIPRGSFVTSYPSMAKSCNLSVKQIRTAFSHLGRLQFAAYQRAGKWTMVTVSNYETYQISGGNRGTIPGRNWAACGQDAGRTGATIEELKKGEEVGSRNTPDDPDCPNRDKDRDLGPASLRRQQYPKVRNGLSCYMNSGQQGGKTPSHRIVADLMDATNGASEEEVLAVLKHLYEGRGLSPGSTNGPRSWKWFVTAVPDEIQKQRARIEAANPTGYAEWERRNATREDKA